MKNILLFFLIALLMDGVFGESVLVTERDSVTLHTGLSEIQENDVIQWRLKTDLIAQFNTVNKKVSLYDGPDGRFKDRLKLDNQTGDLTIRNIRTEHAGDYEVKNFTTLKNSFSVSVVPAVVPPAAVKSVMVGDSVTLHTDLTEIQRDAVIQWRFGQQKSLVAEINRAAGIFNTYDGPDERFRDRLKLDQTGSLTITDARTTDSGDYEVEISSSRSRHTTHHTQSFSVTVRADVETVSVLEGHDVTLHTGLTGIQGTDQIVWKFGDDGEIIADLNDPVNNTDLNHKTGDLTIRNIQTDQSGLYKVEINTRTMILHRKYRITIIDALKSVSVTKGGTVTLQTNVTEIQKDDQIQWMFGDTVLAEINKTDQRFYTSKGPNERFRDRLQLDHQTGSLIITDTRTTDSGLYEVKISSSRHSINRRFIVFVTAVPESGWSSGFVAGIVVGVLLLAAAAVAGVIYYHYKRSRANEENPTLNGTQNPGDRVNEETELTNAS